MNLGLNLQAILNPGQKKRRSGMSGNPGEGVTKNEEEVRVHHLPRRYKRIRG
jgi:hypothetical protein